MESKQKNAFRKAKSRPKGIGLLALLLIGTGLCVASWYCGLAVQSLFDTRAQSMLAPEGAAAGKGVQAPPPPPMNMND